MLWALDEPTKLTGFGVSGPEGGGTMVVGAGGLLGPQPMFHLQQRTQYTRSARIATDKTRPLWVSTQYQCGKRWSFESNRIDATSPSAQFTR
jgi:hypothetical protein